MDIVYSILFCERRFDFNLMRRGVGGNIFRKTHQKVFCSLQLLGQPGTASTQSMFFCFFFWMVEKKIIVYNRFEEEGMFHEFSF